MNCHALLTGMWCSHCGQKWSSHDPTWHDFVHEATHEFLHLDGKIFRTVRSLLTQPGELIAEHLRGRRARYIGALRLYLTMSLIYFVLASVIPNANVDPDPKGSRTVNAEPGAATNATGFWSRVAVGRRVAKENSKGVEETLSHTFPKVMFALVPLFAALLKIVYRNRNRNYPQFFYFSLHLHAAVFVFLVFTLPLQSFASDTWITLAQGIVLLGSFVYLVVALKRVFGGRTFQTFFRASAVTGTYLLAFAASVGIVIVLLFYRLGQAGVSH